ncbi:MAG: NAD(P)H-dependent oxidoreductase [Gammaproteobacteria bacterium]|nr:NAD(P)H-dependent oxidoreductase [Gammaproteobacteria bacterium]
MLKEALEFRYATKKFDRNAKIDHVLLQQCFETARLAPSSYGLQPYRFLTITDQALREKLAPVCYNQPQITTCSVLLVGQARKKIDEAFIERYLENIAAERNVTLESLAGYRQMMLNMIVNGGASDQEQLSWTQKQLYLGLGVLIGALAEARIDACPMEGFIPQEVDRVLETDRDYHSSVLLAVGLRDVSDQAAMMKKVRWPLYDLFVEG